MPGTYHCGMGMDNCTGITFPIQLRDTPHDASKKSPLQPPIRRCKGHGLDMNGRWWKKISRVPKLKCHLGSDLTIKFGIWKDRGNDRHQRPAACRPVITKNAKPIQGVWIMGGVKGRRSSQKHLVFEDEMSPQSPQSWKASLRSRDEKESESIVKMGWNGEQRNLEGKTCVSRHGGSEQRMESDQSHHSPDVPAFTDAIALPIPPPCMMYHHLTTTNHHRRLPLTCPLLGTLQHTPV
ncbi:hypothetical protein FB45DRAFT_875933 [Roridomyces roridus]|uniref:Uncharacterized protein n=1 Tax=Roridomyces roridus TaxID=1738132 RepID=A0AAD7B5B0_9AGAR|nr:hypothetical protein FB45DRAFT_875933 [Roridomyces roridus]